MFLINPNNPHAYFEHVTGARALLVDQETALLGNALVSAETTGEGATDFETYVKENFESFLRTVRKLSFTDQQVLLEYYLLNIPQKALAVFGKTTQTYKSSEIRNAVKRFCALILFGEPSEERIRKILTRCGHERVTFNLDRAHDMYLTDGKVFSEHMSDRTQEFSMSELIARYRETRSFFKVAYRKKIYRPQIRRAFNDLVTKLEGTQEQEAQALSTYLYGMIFKANKFGGGPTPREAAKWSRYVNVTLPPCLGQYEVDLQDPAVDLEQMFFPKGGSIEQSVRGEGFDDDRTI
jgi:hypothetical protein